MSKGRGETQTAAARFLTPIGIELVEQMRAVIGNLPPSDDAIRLSVIVDALFPRNGTTHPPSGG